MARRSCRLLRRVRSRRGRAAGAGNVLYSKGYGQRSPVRQAVVVDHPQVGADAEVDHAHLDLTRQNETEACFSENKIDYLFLSGAKVGGIFANKKIR